MQFTVIAVSVPALGQVHRFEKEYKKQYPQDDLHISCFYVAGREEKYFLHPEILTEAIKTADIVVIDTMGASEALQEVIRQGLLQCKGQRIIIGNALREYIKLGSFTMGAMGEKKKKPAGNVPEDGKPAKSKNAMVMMHRMRRMALMLGNVLPFGMTKDMKNVFLLMDYWQQATPQDMDSFMHLLLRQYAGKKFLPKESACTMRYGIYLKNPQSLDVEEDLIKYGKKWGYDRKKDTVAVLFYGHSYPNDFLPVVRAVCEQLQEQYNILPIAFSQNEEQDLDTLKSYLCQKQYPVTAIINLMPFRLGAGPMGGNAERAVDILKEADVCYLKPFCLTKISDEQWEEADAVNPGEFLISILLPELDGGILTYPIGIMQSECPKEQEQEEEETIPQLVPIPERITSLCQRMQRLICLQKRSNSQKKLAVIAYNYPPGESTVFGGAFLDTAASLAALLQGLKQAGYETEPLSAEELLQAFTTGGRCNQPQWGEEAATELTYTLDGKEYAIKGITSGHVFIGLQPVRESEHMDADAVRQYHDRNQEPPKAYQAFYRWIREEFQADAILHFGTHGTLEFLPGKDNGMTGSCWPDCMVGSIPHFYYYYMGNPSEAMVAKRRSHATLLSYQAPPLKPGKLYGKYQELKEMIAEYRESMQSAPERCNDLLKNIDKAAGQCGWLDMSLDDLEEKLYEYENCLMTDGLHIINAEEMQGILRAMNGAYIPVRPAGDVIRNPDRNPEILPSGNNLVQFDPRLVPTKTAYERGAEAAKKALDTYVKRTGKYPETTAVILWGLETSRSQGETIGQILYYLGLRLKTEKSSYDDRLEIIPMEELKRPRIDVVIHICGFFRDMYPNLIDNLNEMLQRLSRLEEREEDNYFIRNTKKLAQQLREQKRSSHSPDSEQTIWEMASCRIFGPKEGEYGTRLTEVVRTGGWKAAEELGDAFFHDLSYAYSYRHRGQEARKLVQQQYDQVKFISQVRSTVEYELTDLDHYYEFYGGLAKAVENTRGQKPVMLVADTTGTDVKVQDIQEALHRGIVTRLLNPEWIAGMMRHEYHGVQQIAKRFENVMGFAATTDAVDSATFSQMTRCYVQDTKLRQQMQESNRWAYMKMMERLMEANNRGYYQATNAELSAIQQAYLEAEGEAEEE